MIFSSIPFLYYFLPAVLVLYFIVPRRFKNTVLLLASLFFYAWGEPKYVFLMMFSILAAYVFGRLVEKFRGRKASKVCLVLSIIVSLSFLLYFKYADFFIANFNAVTGLGVPLLRIALPIGISFYTFQIISYTVDVYRGEAAQRNIINLAAYVAMFPQLIAGPIVRYSDVNTELCGRTHSFRLASEGFTRFVIGLGKKILIANQLGELVAAYQASGEKSVLFTWLYAVAYALHVYFDFSGYSDMAIGLGRVFGFHFLENFNYPFISASITEFWRRWHMSLGSWFRDYVYIPLGGNRVGPGRHLFNILVVWMLTGFWHGAAWNFVLWGLYFAVLLILEKLFLLRYLKKSAVLSHLYVILTTLVSFMIFNASSIPAVWREIGGLFGAGGLPLSSPETIYTLRSFAAVLVLALIGSTPLIRRAVEKLAAKPLGSKIVSVLQPVAVAVLMVVMTAYLVDGSFNPFLYFRF